MTRTAVAVAVVLVGATVSATAAATLAQSYPDDAGTGTQRGIAQLAGSGQVGTVTLYRRARATRVVVNVQGTLPGRVQSVALVRGPSCDELGARAPYRLTALRDGVSTTPLVAAPQHTLLSGNYNLVVFSSQEGNARPTACGHLYA